MLSPVAPGERIATLDVIRGIALLGIFLMNVEFFGRPVADLDGGLAPGAQGLDYWVGWAVHVFVRGKFWTMFSLLFGMGFAVMLARAEQAGRGFLAPYLRRTLALAAFGAMHFILVWSGDILGSYALGAVLLVLAFHGRPAALLATALGAIGTALMLGLLSGPSGELPWQPLAGIGTSLLILAGVAAALQRWPVSGLRNAGLALYVVPFLLMTLGAALALARPPVPAPAAAPATAAAPAPDAKAQRRAGAVAEAERAIAEEARVMSGGSYAQAVALRAGRYPSHMARDIGFAVIVLGMFLLGAWFVRSGAIVRPEAHLPLFRRLLVFGLPLGLGMSLLSAAIATSHVRGVNDLAFQLASGLALLGNLPACLGYVAAIVLAMRAPWGRWLSVFGPAGRMALTNYLAQSVVGTLFFYGYGLGHWGMGRAPQLLFVAVVFAMQLALSRWWLARFRYGPLEWLWRGVTYLRWPSMRASLPQPA